MRVTHLHSALDNPDRLARIEAHRQRVGRNESKKHVRRECKRPVRISHLKRLLDKIDRIDAMGRNWGWSEGEVLAKERRLELRGKR